MNHPKKMNLPNPKILNGSVPMEGDTLETLKELEKVIFTQLGKIFFDSECSFRNGLWEASKKISELYSNHNLRNIFDVNAASLTLERHLEYSIYANIDSLGENGKPFFNPASSDIMIEFDRYILSIDAKTINMITNPGDWGTTFMSANQHTFDDEYEVAGVPYRFKGNLPPFIDRKPVLTYFFKAQYVDDERNDARRGDEQGQFCFGFVGHQLACIPHHIIVEQSHEFDPPPHTSQGRIVTNVKSYDYITKEKAKTIFGPRWGPLRLNCERAREILHNMEIEVYTEEEVGRFIESGCLLNFFPIANGLLGLKWGKIDSQLRCRLGPKSYRVNDERIRNRTANSGIWTGVKDDEYFGTLEQFAHFRRYIISQNRTEVIQGIKEMERVRQVDLAEKFPEPQV